MTRSDHNFLGCAALKACIGTNTLFGAGCGYNSGDLVAVNVTFVSTLVVSEVEVSEVPSLLGEFSSAVILNSKGDADGVLAFLQLELETVQVSGKVLSCVGSCDCFVLGYVEGCIYNLLISGTLVNDEASATVVIISLQSEVNSEIIDTSFVYVNFVVEVLGGEVGCTVIGVNVCIRHGIGICSGAVHFVVVNEVGALYGSCLVIFGCVNVVYTFACKLCRKSVCEGENVVLTVLVSVVIGNVVNKLYFECAAFNGALVFCVELVTRSNDYFLGAVTVEALVGTSALFGAGCGYNSGDYVAVGVAESCCEFSLAYGTGLCSFASCCSAGGVAESCYVLRSLKNFVTNGALLTSSLTSFGTGCCYSVDCNFGVTERRNLFLSYDDFTALRALLAVSLTSFCAGGVLTGNNFLGMNVGGGGRFGSGRFGGLLGSFLRSGLYRLLVEQVTRSDREHHSNGKYQSQNAKNILVFHA